MDDIVLCSYQYGTGLELPKARTEASAFAGWFDNEQLTGNAVSEIGKTETGDREFWAGYCAFLDYTLSGGVDCSNTDELLLKDGTYLVTVVGGGGNSSIRLGEIGKVYTLSVSGGSTGALLSARMTITGGPVCACLTAGGCERPSYVKIRDMYGMSCECMGGLCCAYDAPYVRDETVSLRHLFYCHAPAAGCTEFPDVGRLGNSTVSCVTLARSSLSGQHVVRASITEGHHCFVYGRRHGSTSFGRSTFFDFDYGEYSYMSVILRTPGCVMIRSE